MELGDDGLEVRLAGFFDGDEGGGGQLVGGEVGSGIFHPDEGAVVGDEVVGEELFGSSELFSEQSPEATTGDFRAFAVEAGNGALGVFVFGGADFAGDFEPVADVVYFAEGDAGLGHAVGAGVHAHEEDALGFGAVLFEIVDVRFPCVFEGIVGMSDGGGEGEAAQVLAKGVGGVGEGVHGR